MKYTLHLSHYHCLLIHTCDACITSTPKDILPLIWLVIISSVECFRGLQSTSHTDHLVITNTSAQFSIFKEAGRAVKQSAVEG